MKISAITGTIAILFLSLYLQFEMKIYDIQANSTTERCIIYTDYAMFII